MPIRLGPVSGGRRALVVAPPTPPPVHSSQGAYSFVSNANTSLTPSLPLSTTPGRLLLSISLMYGSTGVFPPADGSRPTFTGSPWTFLAGVCVDYSGQNIGGGGVFTPNCAAFRTFGNTLVMFYRFVQAGEVTSTPTTMQCAINTNHMNLLYEFSTASSPGATTTYSANLAPTNPATATMPVLAGNVLGIFNWQNGAGHFATSTPTTGAVTAGTLLHQGRASTNDDTLPAAANQNDAWYQIATTSASVQIVGKVNPGTPTPFAAWTSLNVNGVAVALPAGIVVPAIPYPANSVYA